MQAQLKHIQCRLLLSSLNISNFSFNLVMGSLHGPEIFFFLNITPQAGAGTCARVLFVPALLPAGWSSVPGCSPAAAQSEHYEASDRQFIARSTLCCEKSQIWAMCKAQLSLSFCETWLQGEKIKVLRSNVFLPFFTFLHTAQMQ